MSEFVIYFEEREHYKDSLMKQNLERNLRRRIRRTIALRMDDRKHHIENIEVFDVNNEVIVSATVVVEAGSGFWANLSSKGVG